MYSGHLAAERAGAAAGAGISSGGCFAFGVLGGIIATLGLVAPSIIIILIIAGVLKKFRDNKYVSAAFYGLRPASKKLHPIVFILFSAVVGVVFAF